MPDEDWKINCHEAGHAIVAVRHEITFDCVKRADGEKDEVFVAPNPVDDNECEWCEWSDAELMRVQEYYAAGAAAERIMFQEERQHASREDRCNHDKLERQLNRQREFGFEEDVQGAMRLLDRCSIEKVAARLQEKRTLDFDEVARTIGYTPSWAR
jgi:hypothetical protein